MNSLTEIIEPTVRTLASVMKDRGEDLLVAILQHSSIDIRETSYDNWDGGTYGYTLHLRIAIDLYSKIQEDIESIEKKLLAKLEPLTRAYENEFLEGIIISPKLLELSPDSDNFTNETPLGIGTIKFWEPGYLRLFLTHLSNKRKMASDIQENLKIYGISAFVAHEDIEPTKEWQEEIELALSSMDALAALLTDGFIESKWCDQEIGVALGRKVLVIPLRIGIDPYGLIGKYQGLSLGDQNIDSLCHNIFSILLENSTTRVRMTTALVNKTCNSKSFSESKSTVSLLSQAAPNITPDMAAKLKQAVKDNRQVYDSFNVADKNKDPRGKTTGY